MVDRARGGRRLGVALLPALAWLAACAAAARPAERSGIAGWAEGPTRWLMLPEESREAHRLRTNQEAVAFIEAFWSRRDPDPRAPGNPFAQTFYERVEAADSLYTEDGRRGSMTDRGRALLLLGPPSVLRYNQTTAPAWVPGQRTGKPAIRTRRVVVESWTYRAEDLTAAMVERLAREGRPAEVALVFVVEPRRTYLVEGEKLLDATVRAALRGGAR